MEMWFSDCSCTNAEFWVLVYITGNVMEFQCKTFQVTYIKWGIVTWEVLYHASRLYGLLLHFLFSGPVDEQTDWTWRAGFLVAIPSRTKCYQPSGFPQPPVLGWYQGPLEHGAVQRPRQGHRSMELFVWLLQLDKYITLKQSHFRLSVCINS